MNTNRDKIEFLITILENSSEISVNLSHKHRAFIYPLYKSVLKLLKIPGKTYQIKVQNFLKYRFNRIFLIKCLKQLPALLEFESNNQRRFDKSKIIKNKIMAGLHKSGKIS